MLVILFSSLPKSYFRPSQPHTQEFSLFFLPVSFSVIFFLFYRKSFLHNDSVAKRLSLALFSPRRPLFSISTRYGKITFRPRLERWIWQLLLKMKRKVRERIFCFCFFLSCQLVNKEVGPRCSIYRGESEIGLVYANNCSGELESYFAFLAWNYYVFNFCDRENVRSKVQEIIFHGDRKTKN